MEGIVGDIVWNICYLPETFRLEHLYFIDIGGLDSPPPPSCRPKDHIEDHFLDKKFIFEIKMSRCK